MLPEAGVYSESGVGARGDATRLSRDVVRGLAWLAIGGQVAFVLAWIVAGALEPGYSHVSHYFSDLSAGDAAHPAVMRAGFVVLGISIAALAVSLPPRLPSRPATRIAAGAFALAGAALVVYALFPADCGLSSQACVDRLRAGDLSWQTSVNVWAGLVFDLAFVITPFAIARALWPRHASLLALLAAGSALPILVGTMTAERTVDGVGGLTQRLGFLAVHAWVLIVAIGILHSTRARPAPGKFIPVRPRDFFGRAWSGHGTLSFWPWFVWGRVPRRLRFDREVEWVTDEMWRVEDRVTYADGEVESWKMVARFAEPDRVHVTGDRLPGGADMLLEEGGYRMAPYRFTTAIGPLRFNLRMHDEVRPAGPGAGLEWRIRFTWLGLPVARLVGRVSPVGDEPLEV